MEEEVDLRDYINILMKWKWLIVWITVISMLVAGVYSYFILPKTYESTVTFLVSQPQIKPSVNESELNQIINPATFLALPSIATYSQIVQDPGFLEIVVNKLRLDKKNPPITASSLAGMISVDNPKDSTLIEVKVDDTDPKEAYEIAKAIGDEFSAYALELNKVHLNSQSAALESQMQQAIKNLQQEEESYKDYASSFASDILSAAKQNLEQAQKSYKDYASSFASDILSAAKQNLEQAQKSYKDYATNLINTELTQSLSNLLSATKQYNNFLASKDNIDVLSKEIDVKLSKLSEYQSDLADYKLQLASYQVQLAEAQKQFSSTDQFITLTKSVADSPFLTQLAADPNNPNFKDLVNLQMKSTIVNPLYEKLNDEISALQIEVKDTIEKQSTVKTLNDQNLSALYTLQQELADKKTKLTDLSNALEIAQNDYNTAVSHYKNLDSLLSLNAGGLIAKDPKLRQEQLQLIALNNALQKAQTEYNAALGMTQNFDALLSLPKGGTFMSDPKLRQEQLQLISLNKKLSEAQWNYDTANAIYKDFSKIQNIDLGGLLALNPAFRSRQLQLITLNRELQLAQSKYNLLKDSYNESQIVQTMNIATLKLATEPVVPTHPIKPKKLFNIAVAGTAGFFFAILLAFFLEYMQGSEDKKRIEKNHRW